MRPLAGERPAGGLTLVEVIVSLALLAMTVLVVSQAFLTLLGVARGSGDLTLAGVLAVRAIEETRSLLESRMTAEGWAEAFDRIEGRGPAPFPSPYSRYEYELLTDRVVIIPPGALPCWPVADSPAYCALPDHRRNDIKWITVRVSKEGRTLARVGSAVIGGMRSAEGGQPP